MRSRGALGPMVLLKPAPIIGGLSQGWIFTGDISRRIVLVKFIPINTELYQILLNYTRFYWIIPGYTSIWALRNALLVSSMKHVGQIYTNLYYIIPHYTTIRWIIPDRPLVVYIWSFCIYIKVDIE